MEVCSLSSGMMLRTLNPYPFHYKTRVPIGRAYSIFLYLLPYGLALRFGFPCRRATGLPRSVSIPVCFRLCLYAEGAN
jgi:hypothetical protein